MTQSLDDSTHFVEEFTVESWEENLRQHDRMAVSDMELHARARSFHRGTEPPRIQHFIARDVRVPSLANSSLLQPT